MANEITVTASISVNKPAVMTSALSRALTGSLFSMSGNFIQEGVMTVTTAAVAIPLGSVTAPHWCWLYNLDATNFIRIMNGSGGAKVGKMKAGEFCLFPWDDTAVPFAQADTASCLMEYLLISL